MSYRRTFVAFVCILGLAGCVSERELAQERQDERDVVFEAWKKLPELKLAEGESSWFWRLESAAGQSLHLLMLAPDAMLKERYHKRHDLTLVCIQGSAVVEVEGERRVIQAPASAFIPRLNAYMVIPHGGSIPFVALAVYAPAFDGEDVIFVPE